MKKEQKITGGTFFSLAMYAFLGLGMEIVLLTIENMIYGNSLSGFSDGQNIVHWIITCLIWIGFAFVLLRSSKNKYSYDALAGGKDEAVPAMHWVLAALAAVACIAINAFGWGTLKIIGEFRKKSIGIFLFQYMYYIFEVVLVWLVVCFGQRAGELWFSRKNIPWGGITAGLSWGLVHALTKGSITIGLSALLAGILYGVIYLLLKKKAPVTYLFILLAFVI